MDNLKKEQRSYIMSKIKGKNTKPEMIVRQFLFANGFRYRIHDRRYPGKPDIVLPKYKTIILVNGCFWHGHDNCKLYRQPASNTEFWSQKISRNVNNDLKNEQKLRELGFKVIVLWECKIITGDALINLIDQIRT